MFELVAMILLAILSVVGMVMAGLEKTEKKKKGYEERIVDFAEKVNNNKIVRTLSAGAVLLDTAHDVYKAIKGKNKSALLYDLPVELFEGLYTAAGSYTSGPIAPFLEKRYRSVSQGSEESETWTGGYVSRSEAENIYLDVLGKTPSIREQYRPRNSSGMLVRAVTTVENNEPKDVIVDSRLSRGAKLHAHHHEAYHVQNPGLSEAEVERRTWEHYVKNPMEHLEEISSLKKYYTELQKNYPKIFGEIKKNLVGG